MENNCAKLYRKPSKIVGVMVQTKIGLSSVTLTLALHEGMFQMAHLHVMENNCIILFSNPSTIVEVMVWTNLDKQKDVLKHEPMQTCTCHCDNS